MRYGSVALRVTLALLVVVSVFAMRAAWESPPAPWRRARESL